MQKKLVVLVLGLLVAGCANEQTSRLFTSPKGVIDTEMKLPEVSREFRAAWVATVANIDWPSKPGLSVEDQKAEMIAILDRAEELNLNAIVFQVRCATDALYESKLEPWSAYLTGKQGQAPDPFYDPLEFAVKEAHARGLELHAWFNPFRAGHPAAKNDAPDHVSQKHPDWVRDYGKYPWLDPSEPAAAAHSFAVFKDVLERYDIDGVHVDDYFYPYPITDKKGQKVEFPDDSNWEKYQASGGKLSRDDWRRDNINRFMKNFYETARKVKPYVKVGISPFGIWRPGHPEQIKGFDAYEELYADAKLWFEEGWVDYLTPQLYWRIDPPAQSYPVLLKWWTEQNKKNRHVWPGNYLGRITGKKSWPIQEIANQIKLTRKQPGAGGNVFFSMKYLVKNTAGINELIAKLYEKPALVPATPWLDNQAPPAPKVVVNDSRKEGMLDLKFKPGFGEKANLWMVHLRYGDKWKQKIISASHARLEVPIQETAGKEIDTIAVQSVDRCGNLSLPVVIR